MAAMQKRLLRKVFITHTDSSLINLERERTDDINEKAVLIQNECDKDHKRASIMFKEFCMYKPEGKFYKEWYAYTRLDYAVYPTKKIVMEDGFVKIDENVRKKFIEYCTGDVKFN